MAVLSEEPALPTSVEDAVRTLFCLDLAAAAQALDAPDWTGVARASKILADSLRSEELRTAVGQRGVILEMGALLQQAVHAPAAAGAELLAAQTELVRVVGNLCFDHDANRQQVLDAEIPLYLAQLLTRTVEPLAEGGQLAEGEQRRLTIAELKLVRAITGALLNSSLKFDPMRRYLAQHEILSPLLRLLDPRTTAGKRTAPIYIPGCWARGPAEGEDADEWEERVGMGQVAAGWSANVLEDVLGESKVDFPRSGVLPLVSVVLSVFSTTSPASPPSLPQHLSAEDATDYLDTDIELLTISSALLESLAEALPFVATALAFFTYDPALPHPQRTTLHHLLSFIADASTPPHWALAAVDDPARAEKAFAAVKAAVVRAVVEAPNDDAVMERLWKETKSEEGRSWLVEMLVRWLERTEEGREDMTIAAAHLLAGLGRKDEHTLSLVHDYHLAAPLARIVRERVEGAIGRTGRPGETTQILFGVVGLLRHLAIPLDNRQIVGETGVIPYVAQLLCRELDIVQPLQLAVIGMLKHLAAGSLSNSLAVLGLTSSSSSSTAAGLSPTPLDLLLALIARTDEQRLRSEGPRVLVNLIRSLFALPSCAASHADAQAPLVAQGWERIVRREVADALAELVRRSEKWPILVNEGVVGLTLLAGSGADGAALVLSALLTPPSRPAPAPAPEAHPLDPSSTHASISALPASHLPTPAPAPPPEGEPASAAEMLARWFALAPTLSPAPSPAALLRPEMLGNAAALVLTVSRGAPGAGAERARLAEVLVALMGAAAQALEGEAGEKVRVAVEALREGVAE
ncbi:hypothetical protein JCM10450v2_004807 [Rhodotorula kratochvilovae]